MKRPTYDPDGGLPPTLPGESADDYIARVGLKPRPQVSFGPPPASVEQTRGGSHDDQTVGDGEVDVAGYTRADGTRVNGYTRQKKADEMTDGESIDLDDVAALRQMLRAEVPSSQVNSALSFVLANASANVIAQDEFNELLAQFLAEDEGDEGDTKSAPRLARKARPALALPAPRLRAHDIYR